MEAVWDEVFFWKQLELEYGQVSIHIKNILKLQNLCRHSLGNLTKESIYKIAEDMRRMADHHIKAAKEGGLPLHELYGMFYAEQPHKFEFLEGEVMCMLDLGAIIRNRGIKSFLRQRRKQYTSTQASTSVTMPSLNENLNGHNLYEKIMAHFSSKKKFGSLNEKFLTQLQHLKIEVFSDEDNTKFRAEVLCPICCYEGKSTKISLTTDRTGSWHIFGFTRHCNSYHLKASSNQSKPKRNFSPSGQVEPAKRMIIAASVRCENIVEDLDTDDVIYMDKPETSGSKQVPEDDAFELPLVDHFVQANSENCDHDTVSRALPSMKIIIEHVEDHKPGMSGDADPLFREYESDSIDSEDYGDAEQQIMYQDC